MVYETKMNKIFLTSGARNRARQIPLGLGLAIALAYSHNAGANEVYLGTANNYAVLDGSTITSTGPTVINGGLGLSPGSAVTAVRSSMEHTTWTMRRPSRPRTT